MQKEPLLFEALRLYVGIDVHKKQWSVSIYTGQIHHRTFSQAPEPDVLQSYLEKHFPEAEVHCAYEATRFGFWIARALIAFGYSCLVVNPADIPLLNRKLRTRRIE